MINFAGENLLTLCNFLHELYCLQMITKVKNNAVQMPFKFFC